MKSKIETIVYRITDSGILDCRKLEKLQKKYKKTIPQILYIGYSSDESRPTDILVGACKTITKKELNSIFEKN